MNVTTVLSFVLAMVFVIGGLVLMGYAFDAPAEWRIWLFSAGAVAEFVGVAVPALLWQADRRKSQQ